ncbi:MAG: hypothetical protein QM753_08750 [Thermomicrobiales bacterium]
MALNKQGQPCRAEAQAGSEYCRWHDPALAEQRRAWAVKGGQGRSNRARAKKGLGDDVLTPGELMGSLSRVLKKLEAGEAEPGVATAMASVARAIADIRKTADMDDRLRAIEEQAGIVHIDGRRSS